MDNKTLSDIIGLIYDTALDTTLWPQLLQKLHDELTPFIEEIFGDGRDGGTADNRFSERPERCEAPFGSEEGGDPADRGISKYDLMDLLKSHFNRALALNQKVFKAREEQNRLQLLFERLPLGILVVDGQGRVLTYNRGLETHSEIKGLTIRNHQLTAASSLDNRRLQQAIRAVAGNPMHPGETVRLSHPDTAIPLSALVIPFKHTENYQDESGDCKAVVIVAAPEMHPALSAQTLIALYQLTEAEAKLVISLLQDRSPIEIAADFGVSKHTVRNQLKAVYEKTGTHRQAELVRQIITGPAMLATLSGGAGEVTGSNGRSGNAEFHRRHHQTMRLPDGRRLGFAEYGDSAGRPVIHMHAANGSRLERHPEEKIIASCGIRFIVPERPGVGLSDSRKYITLLNWTEDVACLADHLGLETFSITGYSLGGAFALACAHSLQDRVKRLVTISSAAPFNSVRELDGMLLPFRMMLLFGRHSHTLVAPVVRLLRFHFTEEIYKHGLFKNLPPVDQALVYNSIVRERIRENVFENLRRKEHSILQEALLVARPWGFEIGEIKLPVEIWHGEQDRLVPLQMAKNLAAGLPNCRTHFLPGAGHYLIFHCWKDILLSVVGDNE